jgi:hypothetical protein
VTDGLVAHDRRRGREHHHDEAHGHVDPRHGQEDGQDEERRCSCQQSRVRMSTE